LAANARNAKIGDTAVEDIGDAKTKANIRAISQFVPKAIWKDGVFNPARVRSFSEKKEEIMLDKAPNGRVTDLLNALDKALSAGEVERAVDLFQTDCYWRDLVTFTWNIKTMEGHDQVRDMLKTRLAETKPSNWKIADGENASEADGITDSWIQFETGVASVISA
jgi:hypothetical protein